MDQIDTSTSEANATPLEVRPVDAGVVVVSAEGEAVTLTPEAAAATARRMLHAAGQQAEPETYQKPLG